MAYFGSGRLESGALSLIAAIVETARQDLDLPIADHYCTKEVIHKGEWVETILFDERYGGAHTIRQCASEFLAKIKEAVDQGEDPIGAAWRLTSE